MLKAKNQGGFTLVELAVVMMIIGLLIGGVLKGQELIENARITALISQVKAYESATTTFRDTYNALPGDLVTATTRLPNCGTGCTNGNGNSIIGATNGLGTSQTGETIGFWRHLLMADLINGVTTTGTAAFGESHPAARLGGGFTVGHRNTGGTFVSLQSTTGAVATTPGANPLSPLRAAQVDRRIDDGSPTSGSVLGTGVTTSCATGTAYAETVESKDCGLFFQIQG